MPLQFKDVADDVCFEYSHGTPKQAVSQKFSATLLTLYGLTRNAMYASYTQKEDLSSDIKNFNPVYQEKSAHPVLQKYAGEPLYHYCVAASTTAFVSSADNPEVLQCYLAKDAGSKGMMGFVQFLEKGAADEKMVYIALAAVSHPGRSIGRRLLQCVLQHYPAGTEFQILTRIFNTEAKNLYQQRLGFTPLEDSAIVEFGYSPEKYCGFRWVSDEAALREIQGLIEPQLSAPKISY